MSRIALSDLKYEATAEYFRSGKARSNTSFLNGLKD